MEDMKKEQLEVLCLVPERDVLSGKMGGHQSDTG